jgi:hypothetical protein
MIFEPVAELELADIQRFRLGNRADDWMKCLAVRNGMNRVRTAGELDELVTRAGNGRKWFQRRVRTVSTRVISHLPAIF